MALATALRCGLVGLATLASLACGARTGLGDEPLDATFGQRPSDAAVDCLPDVTPYLAWYFGTLTGEVTSWRYLTDAGIPGATVEGVSRPAWAMFERADGGGVRVVVVEGAFRVPVAIVPEGCRFTVQRDQLFPDVNGIVVNHFIYEGTLWFSQYALTMRMRFRGQDYTFPPIESEGFDTFEGRRP